MMRAVPKSNTVIAVARASSPRRDRAPSPDSIVDPEGGAQDVRRFSTRQEASSKNPGHVSDGRFESALSVSLVTFFAPKKVTRAQRGSC
jgi:hypothetical protein